MTSTDAMKHALGRRALLSILFVGALGAALPGCATPQRKVFDARLASGRFAFVMGQGSEWHGFDVIRINSRGECWYTFSELDPQTEQVVWREAAFSVSRDTMIALKAELNDIAFFSLNDEYKGKSAAATGSRSQWFVKVRIGEQKKSVFMDNEFPLQAMRLEKFISEKVLDPRREDFKQARAIKPEQGQEPIRF
jgi:hypothetical protein